MLTGVHWSVLNAHEQCAYAFNWCVQLLSSDTSIVLRLIAALLLFLRQNYAVTHDGLLCC